MSTPEKYRFESIYKFANIVSESVDAQDELFWFDEEEVITSATAFDKKSLLHIYVEDVLFRYYYSLYKHDGDIIEDEDIEKWFEIFESYNILCNNKEYNLDDEGKALEWFDSNEDSFWELFSVIANEVVHIMFLNKNLLLRFNNLIINTIKEIEMPDIYLTEKGTIKRKNIPQWVKKAVFYRDNGRCVFCNKDLTGIITTLNSSNFDHMIPLDKMGVNDPCNIQLCCETCNKSKGGAEKNPIYQYEPRW